MIHKVIAALTDPEGRKVYPLTLSEFLWMIAVSLGMGVLFGLSIV